MAFAGAAFLLWELSTPFGRCCGIGHYIKVKILYCSFTISQFFICCAVYIRWFLWKMDKTKTKLYLYNGLLMTVTFFLCRNVFGTGPNSPLLAERSGTRHAEPDGSVDFLAVMSVVYWRATANELSSLRPGGMPHGVIWLYRVFNVALNALNFFWFYKMASGAIRVLRGKESTKKHRE